MTDWFLLLQDMVFTPVRPMDNKWKAMVWYIFFFFFSKDTYIHIHKSISMFFMLQATVLKLVDMVDKEQKQMVNEIWSIGLQPGLGVREILLYF